MSAMLKILTILGTRPEIIRLSRVIDCLDKSCRHILVHTGQNFDKQLNDIFFKELGIRRPDYNFRSRASSFAGQIGRIFCETEKIISQVRPDKLLVLGDTNSALSAFVAKRMGVPVYHMEAGNRCYSDVVPEEVNRRLIDHSSDMLLPYTHNSRQNLLKEGLPSARIIVTGNPINEVLRYYKQNIERSKIHRNLSLDKGNYVLATFHRQENVDIRSRLSQIMQGLKTASIFYKCPVVVSVHPRTRIRLKQFFLKKSSSSIHFLQPLGFFDFIALEKHAKMVITDSGTVQEECCLFGIPTVTIRDVTERPETVECGSNVLAGVNSKKMLFILRHRLPKRGSWKAPVEYTKQNVSSDILKILKKT